ncbi:MAG: metal ABC transporter permease [Candidatus Auribacterota bacterium]|jgi:zinc transport system permease protein|nr:metal ABC transporter permease [Candidatus Auribacterota bacterium]
MSEFITALKNPDMLFLRYALIAGLLASVSFGIMGTYVVVRRISYIAGAISHCVLGGIGVALYLQHAMGYRWCTPLLGAFCSALMAALIIGIVAIKAKQREDTVIGAIWSTGMAIGLLFIARTPGYLDPMNYLFGNILLITKNDVWLIAMLDVVIVFLGLFFYNKFLAVCFDEEFAKTRNVRVEFYYILLLCMTALTVFLLVRLVGIIMVIALLTLPVAIAGFFSRHLWQMMITAIAVCMIFITLGLGISYSKDLPTGPTIIILAAAVYLCIVLASRIISYIRSTMESKNPADKKTNAQNNGL